MNVANDGAAKPFFEEGERLYHTRRGQVNVACIHCHENNAGNYIRADLLSEGRSTGFPLYRLKWAGVGTFDRRMEECYGQVRAEPEPYGSQELAKLQLYVNWRENGLLVETPGSPARLVTCRRGLVLPASAGHISLACTAHVREGTLGVRPRLPGHAHKRRVECEVAALVMGDPSHAAAGLKAGDSVKAEGFPARKSLHSQQLVLHLNSIELIERG